MVQLQAYLKEFEATGGRVVAISCDSTNILSRFARRNSITFPLLSDVGSKTIDAYGIRNLEAPARWSGIPHPGTVLVGTNGVIRSKLFLERYQERHSPEALIEALANVR